MTKLGKIAAYSSFVAFVACSSPSAPEPVAQPSEASAQVGGLVAEEFEVSVDVLANTVSFRPVQLSGAAPQLHPKGFKQVNSGNFKFTTSKAVNGASAEPTPISAKDPVGGTTGCNANQFCAQINLSNQSGQDAQEVWVEITSLVPNAGSVTIPSNGDPSLAPSGYTNPTSGYLDFTRGAFAYKNIGAGLDADRNWRFDLSGGATNFTFNVRVLATFKRTSYASVATKNSSVLFNACSGIGTSGTVTTVFNDTSLWNANTDAQIVTLPFPFTIYDTTSLSAYFTTNGVFGLGSPKTVGGSTAVPSCPGGTCNPTTPPRPAIFAFWDDLVMRTPAQSASGGGACYALGTSTASGARRYIVTWRDATFNFSEDSAGVDGTHLTFSLRITEFSDDYEVLIESATMCSLGAAGCNKSCSAQTGTGGCSGQYRCVDDTTLAETNCATSGTCHCRPTRRLAGRSAVIGAQDSTGTTAHAYINNTAINNYVFATSVSAATDLPLYVAFTASPGDPPAVPR